MTSDLASAKLEEWGYSPHFHAQFLALTAEQPALAGCQAARLLSVRRGELSLTLGAAEPIRAVLGGSFAQKSARAPCVGDFVLARLATGDGPARIEQLLTPTTLFERKVPGATSEHQAIAANVDVALVVCALTPEEAGAHVLQRGLNARRIERYLVAIREARVRPVIAVNKADLRADADSLVGELRRELGRVDIVLVSAKEGIAIDTLESELLPGTTSVLVGASGVGKSSLSNRLLGREQQRTQAVREDDIRGRHTTTERELFKLPSGALLIDTPGMREFGLANLDEQAGLEAFDDITALAAECRFRDCQHMGEPGCAVDAAIDNGTLSEARLESARKLEREQRYHRQRHDQAAQHAARQGYRQMSRSIREHMRVKYRA